MERFMIEGKRVSIFPSVGKEMLIVYLNEFSDEGVEVFDAMGKVGISGVSLVAMDNLDWNVDMVPWDFPPDFKGGAAGYLSLMGEKIIPKCEEFTGKSPRAIVGYSLAGLFSLYALISSDLFSYHGSVSGSLWFPGFSDYVLSSQLKGKSKGVYISLGDKEAGRGKGYMKVVGEQTSSISASVKDADIPLVFEYNEGNHFTRPVARTVKGIKWLSNRAKEDVCFGK